MNRLKRWVCLLALLLPAAGLAQEYYTLPEVREQAAAGWHETYTDKYGRTIPVNVDVQVFGEERAPILKVGVPWFREYRDKKNNPYNTVTGVKKSGGRRTYVYQTYGEKVDVDKAYGADYGNDLTLRETYHFFDERLKPLGMSSTDFFIEQPKELDVLCNIKQATGEVIASAFYLAEFWPKMREFPVLTHVGSGYYKQGWPVYFPRASIMMRNEEEYSVYVMTVIEQEMLVEDIPLCSFEKVIGGLTDRIESGHIQNVFSLRFGYVLYNESGKISEKPIAGWDAECYYAVPSWVVECAFSETPKRWLLDNIKGQAEFDERMYANEYVIDAQTGEMLNPFDTSAGGYGDMKYKGFLSWDDVK